MKSRVAVIHNKNTERGIRQALDKLENLSALFRNKVVAVKPNDISPHDVKACTQPDTLRAVIRYIKMFKPKKIIVLGGSGDDKSEKTFKATGMDKIIQKEGAEFFDMNYPPYEDVQLNYKTIKINPKIFEADTLVSLAQHKVHSNAVVTLSMKCAAMGLPPAEYYGYSKGKSTSHGPELHKFIAAMVEKFPIHLAVIAGHPAMIGKGPMHGKTFESELIIASRDAVAADAVGAHLLGFDRVEHILLAEKLGLGNASFKNIDIVGMPLNEAMKLFIEKSWRAK